MVRIVNKKFRNIRSGNECIVTGQLGDIVHFRYIDSEIYKYHSSTYFHQFFKEVKNTQAQPLTTIHIYKNVGTKKRVRILQIDEGLVQVIYIPSGSKAWYEIKDFTKMFTIEE